MSESTGADTTTDAKEPEFIKSLLHSEECGRSLLYDVYENEVCSIAEIVNHIDTLTRERDALREFEQASLAYQKSSLEWQRLYNIAVAERDALRAVYDAAVKYCRDNTVRHEHALIDAVGDVEVQP